MFSDPRSKSVSFSHRCVVLVFSKVIIMGATNRPQDLDSAILRRMPTRFHINQPVSPLILAQNMFDGLNEMFSCTVE